MNENVIQLLQRIRQGAINPCTISAKLRQTCVAYLRLEGYTQVEIAEIFRVSRQTIIRDEKAIRKQYTSLVDELDVKSAAGELMATASQLAAKAIRKEDYALAWRIKCDLITKLQSLGYLPKVADKLNVSIATFADLIRLAEDVDEDTEQKKQIKSEILVNEPKTAIINENNGLN